MTAIDTASRHVQLAGGTRHSYDALVLATGAEPVWLDIPGADRPRVHYLRTLADSHALLAKALQSKCAVVIGASFIRYLLSWQCHRGDTEHHHVYRLTAPYSQVRVTPH